MRHLRISYYEDQLSNTEGQSPRTESLIAVDEKQFMNWSPRDCTNLAVLPDEGQNGVNYPLHHALNELCILFSEDLR